MARHTHFDHCHAVQPARRSDPARRVRYQPRLRGLGLPCDPYMYRERGQIVPRSSSFHVVVLTGNERQAKRSGAIQALVTAETTHPIRVELIAPAWSPNWGRVLTEFRRSLRHADAAVIGTY